ncbi:diguanylate cyclase/phosphodiesterase with MHYT sensor [Paenibacillus vortex V453]|uniref:Diguanylate cyclase/phosphodiesterase with MHYT sensor n=1 Tax=Paenibacillus vortex V453 TaxID=715225 RepID=A0A2R9T0S9_9BACL|nr:MULTISPECIES: bifunctional diguanylate cyclase/phosphodiesterase [Paenibacillus]EFU43245.1 diguanylate cyclase/phosphodiesterase with MHYT sensor [Paenibacillus vortex V453]MDH6671313.1 diguanylate cyclase (GGDEF)-like protein [Paenibacillus sp. LBL]
MDGSYNFYIVGLSIVIAILASYSALNITSKISDASGKSRFFWLFGGAMVMGSGIWSMHFVGMLALHMNMNVKYDVALTIMSMLASVVSSFIAFYITMPRDINWFKIAIGGLIMGSGIVTMHYMGMEAMIMHAEISYDPVIWVLSAIIALAASYAALILFLRFRNHSKSSFLKWGSAVIMGFAVCGMHYTGMMAARFEPHSGMITQHEPQSVDLFLLYCVTITIFAILLISWGAMFFDRHVLEKLAYQDTITGLPNRNEMNRFFESNSETEKISVLFLDLDQFKAINDTLGHHVGDMLVQEVGNRLRQFIQGYQQVFRIGGDEFLIILKQSDPMYAQRLAEDILQKIKNVYFIDGNELYVTGSIGISIGSVHSSDRSTLLKNADTAMYKAKGLGKNQQCLYTEEMGVQEVRKMELEKDLQRALELKEFFIVYQPKWNVKSNRLVGFEALIRWNHPRLGVISPLEFIPIAEETGLIIPMTRWTLEEACKQCRAWKERGIVQPVSVNLSIRLFHGDNLLELVRNVLDKAELDPHLLELEITESMVLHDVNDIIRQLENIRALGVKVSMDDFGTGYSSIGLLDRIPIDALKLDRLFTNDLDTPSKRAIINAIVLMAENLNLDVIAEGVENKEHIDFLTGLGCHVMQGYYYGKPMDIDEIDVWMYEQDHKAETIEVMG